jgi:hypothetical protein
VAVVRNKTEDTLTLFQPDAPPVDPGGEVTIADERFVERAWPTSTWDVVEKPKGYVDASTDDAHLWIEPTPEEYDPGAHGVDEVTEYLSNADEGERARVIAVESAGKARKTILEWSESA